MKASRNGPWLLKNVLKGPPPDVELDGPIARYKL